ncbi:MAG: acyl-CoA/acyl-ACP dehydrogenase [Pseudomonadaceae bacterium]|nr:acyl-CoA/acyl-ACP dehydrogenase [Pseudomonadaceae bacterium]
MSELQAELSDGIRTSWQHCNSYESLEAAVTEIATNIAALHANDVDQKSRFPQETIDALRASGALGAGVPLGLDGLGCSVSQQARLCRVLGASCAASAMILAMHYIEVESIVRHCGDSESLRGYLRRLNHEQRLIASVTSEVGTDGDMTQSIAALEMSGDSFAFEKQATTISYGVYAHDLLVTLRRSPEAAPTDQVVVLVLNGDYELTVTGEWDTLGMRGTCSPAAKVKARGKAWQVLPKPFADISSHTMVPVSHILWSALWLGIASDAVNKVRRLLVEKYRKQPDEIPAKANHLAVLDGKLQQMKAEHEHVTQAYEALLASGKKIDVFNVGFALQINNLKLNASNHVKEIVTEAIQVAGIAAYRNNSEYSLGRHLRDALSASLMISNERIVEYNATLQMLYRDR